MNELLADWCDFCEGKNDFDLSHFYTLFMEVNDRSYFEQVFKYFPNSSELLKRINNIVMFDPTNVQEHKTLSDDELVTLATRDLKERRKAVAKLGEEELVAIIDGAIPKFVPDPIAVEKARTDMNGWHGELVTQFGDYCISNLISKEKKYYTLFNAFYGLTKSFEMQWYLGIPLIETDMNVDNYFMLKRAGGEYALTKNELMIARK